MKWIGQHIWDFISRFRNDVYFENTTTSSETNILVVDSDGKLTRNPSAGGPDEVVGDNETHALKVKKTTISEAQWDALYTTPVQLVPQPGANKIVVPVSCMLFIDKKGAEIQKNSLCHLNVHWNTGSVGVYYLDTYMHFRRFMYNEPTDVTYSLQSWDVEVGQSLTSMIDKALMVSISSRMFYDSSNPTGTYSGDGSNASIITDSDIYVSYYILDVS